MVCCGMVRNEVNQVIDFAQDHNAETFDYSRLGYSYISQLYHMGHLSTAYDIGPIKRRYG